MALPALKTSASLAALVILSVAGGTAWAGTTGKIAGSVTDAETGEPLPRVNVFVEGTDRGAATDDEGDYVILNVPPGIYTLRSSMMGYKEGRAADVAVSVDFTTRVDFGLQLTVLEVGEEIVVTAEKPLVRMDLTSSQAVVGSREIAEMPVEGISDVLEVQAGVVEDAGGAIHVRGGRATEVAYQLDGISLTDAYSGMKAVEIENMAIQELQVISGTFNAEYGRAMSGVVNIVTKEGGDELGGELSLALGDYLSDHTRIFYNIDDANPADIVDFQASVDGPVPGLGERLNFFSSGRFLTDDGYLYGQRLFSPSDDPTDPGFVWPDPDTAQAVSMNRGEHLSLQGKLSFRFSPTVKLTYGALRDRGDSRSYSHEFRYDPDGDYQHRQGSWSHSVSLNHTLSPRTFYTVKLSRFFYDYRHYAFQDPEEILERISSGEPIDSRYVDPDLLNNNAANFRTGGCRMDHLYRNTTTTVGRFDITSQVTKTHQAKTGVEFRAHRLRLHEFELIPKEEEGVRIEPFVPDVPPLESPLHNEYTHQPVEASAYIQDKMEFQDLIVNVGLRYDFFEPDGRVPTDLEDPHNDVYTTNVWDDELDTLITITGLDPVQPFNEDGTYNYWRYKYRDAKPKHQFSPRVGFAYPITDRGAIHFSYGHFFQTPTFEYLYTDPEFEVEKGLETRMGNAALNAQKSVIYEIGLQQQLSGTIAMDITGYYKDIRDLLGTEIHETYQMGQKYALYVNRDYGNVRGITVALSKRRSGYLSASIDYTYQVAEGNASDPDATFWDNQSIPPRESEKQVVPLDWDQTHTLNFSVTLSEPQSWGISLLGRYGSGLPYTPAFEYQRTGFENSERKPAQYNVDLRAHKDFHMSRARFTLFLKIYNLFDRTNEDDVYSDTGRADYTLTRSTGEVTGPLTYDDYYNNRAEYYSAPRQVKVGMSVAF
jgi:hypothetical protein